MLPQGRLRRLRKGEHALAAAFFEQTYGGGYTLSNEAHFDWLFDNHLNDSRSEYTAYVALGKNGSIIGFYAWIPVEFYYFGARVRCNYQMNMMVAERYRQFGYGLLLLNAVENNGGDLGVTLNVGSEGRKLIEPAGWRIFDLDRYVFVLNHERTGELAGGDWPLGPGTLPSFASTDAFTFSEITRTDPRLTALAETLAVKYPITLNRDAAYVQWRWFENPLLTYRVFTVSRGNELVAYLALRIEEYRHFKVGRLLDLISSDAAELFCFASILRTCQQLNVDFVDYFMLGGQHRESLVRAGFVLAAGEPYRRLPMVFNPPDRRPSLNFTFKTLVPGRFDGRIHDLANWHVNKADADGDRANSAGSPIA